MDEVNRMENEEIIKALAWLKDQDSTSCPKEALTLAKALIASCSREAKLREALERGVHLQEVNYGHATETHMALIAWARYARGVLREEGV